MKSAGTLTILVLVTLSLLCSALAVTITYYTEKLCESPANATFQGRPNPLVIPLNQCEQSVSEADDRTALWTKPTFCGFKGSRPGSPSQSSANTAEILVFSDSSCANAVQSYTMYSVQVDACLPAGYSKLPPGALSMRVTCDPASVASVAIVAVVTAVVALCI